MAEKFPLPGVASGERSSDRIMLAGKLFQTEAERLIGRSIAGFVKMPVQVWQHVQRGSISFVMILLEAARQNWLEGWFCVGSERAELGDRHREDVTPGLSAGDGSKQIFAKPDLAQHDSKWKQVGRDSRFE